MMDVNETLSSYSDWCYGIAVGAYVVAMLFYLYEQAFGYRERKAAKELVAVGGGDTLVADKPAEDDDAEDRSVSRTARAVRIGKLGVSLTAFGALLHFGSLVLRALATSRAPWGNMYEFGATLCMVAVATWLVVLRKYPTVRHLGVWVLCPVIVLMFLGGVVLYTTAAPVQPALQSYWLV